MNTESESTETMNAETNAGASADPNAAIPTADDMIARALPELRRKAREWWRDYPHHRLAAVLDVEGPPIVQTLAGVLGMFRASPPRSDTFLAALASFVQSPRSTDYLGVCVLRPVWRWSFHIVDVRPHLRIV